MRKIGLILLLLSFNAYAEPPIATVVPHDEPYYKKDLRNIQLIFTEENLPYARESAEIELILQPLYEKKFGYEMDEKLYVGLISQYNQIANGFSTQYPNNRQINYIGGAMRVDYFASPSWLKTLLYHETAHNYQTNAKDNPVSSSLHSVIGNGAFFIPWFTVPNAFESSFLLEGNAVLNESWHGNGGRLYSGRFKAATLQQAKAGYLTPERAYNNNYYFLYGSHHYTLGGYYQYYIAEKYGLENTNSYWLENSRAWYWPFLTNKPTRLTIGVDFETAFDYWRKAMEDEASNLIDVDGEAVASTQFYSPINGDDEEIYFIVNESGRETPELVIFNKSSGKVTSSRESYRAGKVIKTTDGSYTTQASGKTSPWRIHQGLFDEDAFIIDGTKSKAIQGYLKDGTEVYFDVPGSYDQPQLYVGEEYYGRTNSSVFIDTDDNLYYFVQGEEKERTLYKNKESVLTIKGYFSYISGVDSKGAIYFIANTPYGSGLYRYHDGKMSRAHEADTIIDARLIDDHSALVAVMGSDAYLYKRIELKQIKEEPHEVVLFIEDDPDYRAVDPSIHHVGIPDINLDDPYRSLFEMHYSGANIAFGNDSEAGFIYNLNISWEDPLTQNALTVFLLRNLDQYTLGGTSYANNQFFIQFSLFGYGVISRPDTANLTDERDFGLVADAYLPFWKQGHYSGMLSGHYYQDYESNSREPLSAVLDLNRSEQYGASMYHNFLLSAKPYASSDRGDNALGGELAYTQGLPGEVYFDLYGQYSESNADSSTDSRGVKLAQQQIDKIEDSDPTTVIMPGLITTSYFKSIAKASVDIKKVVNWSLYYFTFPVSLHRSSVFAVYNYYDLEPFSTSVSNEQVNEGILGVRFDTLWLNKLDIPITMQYIVNDNDVLAENSFRVNLGFEF